MGDQKKKTKTLYHYTTKEAARQIMHTGLIKESTDTKTNARFGVGAYMTSMGPKNTQSQIARNNYDGVANQMMKAGKTHAVIEIDMPESQFVEARTDRNIYVAKGNVTVADKNPRVYFRDKDGKTKEYKLN